MGYGQESADTITQTPPVFNLKTNLLYDATGTFNLGAEFRLSDKTSLDVPINWNPFTFSDNQKWKHFMVQPEFRYWTKDVFSGHFFGAHAHYANYNIGNLPKPFSDNMQQNRYEGWALGAGLSYGYRLNFNHNWAMEATIGVGYAYLDYDKFACEKCGTKTADKVRHYVGPTKAGISLIYTFGKKPAKKTVPSYTYPTIVQEPRPNVPQFEVSYIIPEAEPVKRRAESGKAYIDFATGTYDIVGSYKNNAFELNKIRRLIESLRNDPNATITEILITGYASPEGNYESNLLLSSRRASALKNHLKSLYKFPEKLFIVDGLGEDWDTLDSLVANSDIQHKYDLLEIIRGTQEFDVREHKMAAIGHGTPFRQIKTEMYPKLRRCDYVLQYKVAPFSVEKGKEVFATKPYQLSLNEMFIIANTYEAGSNKFNEVFETAARLYPDNDVANLNAAASALSRKDTASAEKYLSKVKKRTSYYHNNKGVLHGLKKQWEDAEKEFLKAKFLGNTNTQNNIEELNKRIKNDYK